MLVGTESAACQANRLVVFEGSQSGTEIECHVESAYCSESLDAPLQQIIYNFHLLEC